MAKYRQTVWIGRQTVGRPRQAVHEAAHATSPPFASSELAGRQDDHMTQETDEILEMTEIPEEVMQEEGIEIEQPA